MKKPLAVLFCVTCSLSAMFAEDKPPRMAAGTADGKFAVATGPASAPVQPVAPGSYSGLLARVTPSVVSVFSATLVHDNGEGDELLERFFGQGKPDEGKDKKDGKDQKKSPASDERVLGVGSGVILTTDGWIVTNSHVIHLPSGRVADAIIVELHDHRRFYAKVAGFDAATDLALLKIETDKLDPLPIADSEAVKSGDLVFAVGNPFRVGITCTMGIISAIHRTAIGMNGPGGYENYIQTDASINPGNSGGALVDASGRLIGINSAIVSTNGSNAGIGFAIPTSLMRRVLAGLAEDGKVARGFFGINSEDLNVLPGDSGEIHAGARIAEIMEGSPAEKAGLKTDDIIVAAAGQPVENSGDLRVAMSFVKPGGTLAVDFMRDGKKQSATLTAIAPKDDEAKGTFTIPGLPGVKFHAEAGKLVVQEITPEAAQRTQLDQGMEIIEVNGDKADSATAVENSLHNGVNKVKVKKGDSEQTLAVRVE